MHFTKIDWMFIIWFGVFQIVMIVILGFWGLGQIGSYSSPDSFMSFLSIIFLWPLALTMAGTGWSPLSIPVFFGTVFLCSLIVLPLFRLFSSPARHEKTKGEGQ